MSKNRRKNCNYSEWLAVRYKDDNILYMCPNVSNQNIKIGSYSMIKWKDGFKYKAKLLCKGTKENVRHYLNKMGEKYSIFTNTENSSEVNVPNNTLNDTMQKEIVSKKISNSVSIDLPQQSSSLAFSLVPGEKVVHTKNDCKKVDEQCLISCNNSVYVDKGNVITQKENIIEDVASIVLEIENKKDVQAEDNISNSLNEIGEKFSIFTNTEVNVPINNLNYMMQKDTVCKDMENSVGVDLPQQNSSMAFSLVPGEKVVHTKNDCKKVDEQCLISCNNSVYVDKGNGITPKENSIEDMATISLKIENKKDAEENISHSLNEIGEQFSIFTNTENNTEVNVAINTLNDMMQKENVFKEMENLVGVDLLKKNSSIEFSFEPFEKVVHTKNNCEAVDEQCLTSCINSVYDNNKNNTSQKESSIEDMATSSLGIQNNKCDLLLNKLNNPVNINKDENDSSDTFNEDEDSGSEYLPYIEDDLSIGSSFLDEMDNQVDSNESEKSVTLQTPLTSRKIFPENNLQVPFVPKTFNFDGEVEKSKKNAVTNKRVWDKLDYCIFCEKQITNFTRHILRKHKDEAEVMKYEALPKGSVDRKQLADILRKRGNFLCNVEDGSKIKPVRRPYEFGPKSTCVKDYLPCKHCLGMYKRKYLYRHFKICKHNKNKTKSRNQPQADGQNMLLAFNDTHEELKTKVFPRMASDNISFVAKSDKLIKAFGSRYLKSHKEKHLISVVSQKMRILARFLICMKSEIPEILSLQQCLTPKYFDSVIKCAKQIAQYNEKLDSFGSPSVILKLGQSLKQCCDIVEFILLKESDGLHIQSNEKNSINAMKYMIEKQWSYEVSSNASKDIYQKKWNKPAILPLSSDIKLFRDYIVKVEKESYNNLKLNHNNLQAFRELQESILAQIVLLNRRRSGEVQRIHLETYNSSSEVSQEEVINALSPVELELTKSFKRIVIRGKRGRGVPVLFSPHLQKRLNFLITLRETVDFIDKDNPYLFPLPQSSDSCMRVSDIIRKFCINSGVKNPENITSTRLRKHVATVTQLLNLSEGDIEQVATFLGHTKDVHKEFYRLSDSAFQVAKISKLLLMIEKGQGNQYRGKSIDEININVNDLISDESSDDEFNESLNQNTSKRTATSTSKLPVESPPVKSFTTGQIENKKIKNKITIIPWKDEEKLITTKYFKKHILLGKAPKKKECEEFLMINPCLNKPWKKIKDFVHNAGNSKKVNKVKI